MAKRLAPPLPQHKLDYFYPSKQHDDSNLYTTLPKLSHIPYGGLLLSDNECIHKDVSNKKNLEFEKTYENHLRMSRDYFPQMNKFLLEHLLEKQKHLLREVHLKRKRQEEIDDNFESTKIQKFDNILKSLNEDKSAFLSGLYEPLKSTKPNDKFNQIFHRSSQKAKDFNEHYLTNSIFTSPSKLLAKEYSVPHKPYLPPFYRLHISKNS